MAGPGVLYLLLDEIIQISKKTLEEFEQYRDCVPAFHDTIEQINNAASITALLNNFRKEYLNELQTCFDNSGQGGNRPIRSALQFIAVHYAQPLTLEMVSEAVHLSPNYFSALFKREMDCSFIEYLTTYRLDQAKKLLRETNYGIAEIAERTGYADARYFS